GPSCRRWPSASAKRNRRLPPSEPELQAELLEVLAGAVGVAAHGYRLYANPVLDAAAEEDAAHAQLATDPYRLSGRLALEGRPVDGAFAGDDEILPGRPLAESLHLEHVLGSRHQLGSERCERGPETARRAAARQLGERAAVLEAEQPLLEPGNVVRERSLLRPEGARRLAQRCPRVAEGDGRGGQLVQHLEETGAAVHRRGAAETDEQPGALTDGSDQLAEAAARGREHLEARRVERDRAGALDDDRPVTESPDRRVAGPAERVVHGDAANHARVEHLGRALAAVRDRRLLGYYACAPEPLREQRRRLARREDALEASRRRERAHEARRDPPRAPPRPAAPPPRPPRACAAASRTRAPRARGRSSRPRRPPTPRSPAGRTRTRSPSRRARCRRPAAARSPPAAGRCSRARAERASPRSSAGARARRPAAASGCGRPASPCRPRRTGTTTRCTGRTRPPRRGRGGEGRRARAAPSPRLGAPARARRAPTGSGAARSRRRTQTGRGRSR